MDSKNTNTVSILVTQILLLIVVFYFLYKTFYGNYDKGEFGFFVYLLPIIFFGITLFFLGIAGHFVSKKNIEKFQVINENNPLSLSILNITSKLILLIPIVFIVFYFWLG